MKEGIAQSVERWSPKPLVKSSSLFSLARRRFSFPKTIMTKKVVGILKMTIEAGKASPAPPVGPALGLRGLNIMNFCKEFNDLTKHYKSGTMIPTEIKIFKDKSIKISLKTPPISQLVKTYLNLEKGHSHLEIAERREIDPRLIFHLAALKQRDEPLLNMESLCRSVLSSCQMLGLKLSSSGKL